MPFFPFPNFISSNTITKLRADPRIFRCINPYNNKKELVFFPFPLWLYQNKRSCRKTSLSLVKIVQFPWLHTKKQSNGSLILFTRSLESFTAQAAIYCWNLCNAPKITIVFFAAFTRILPFLLHNDVLENIIPFGVAYRVLDKTWTEITYCKVCILFVDFPKVTIIEYFNSKIESSAEKYDLYIQSWKFYYTTLHYYTLLFTIRLDDKTPFEK